jgi:hypothetical protein
MEYGETEVDHNWRRISFTGNYTYPVVVSKGASYNGHQASTVRIRNVTTSGFEIRIEEWDYLNEIHTIENVGYLVIEGGIHNLDNGETIEAGYFYTSQTGAFARRNFAAQFETTPVVISSVVTENGGDTITTRQKGITRTGFDYKLQEQQSYGRHDATEIVGYIAWEPSVGLMGNGVVFEVGRTANTVTHLFSEVDFDQYHTTSPVLIAAMQTADGGDSAALRWKNKNSRNFEIMVEEEQSADEETYHTTEQVGYMVFSAN